MSYIITESDLEKIVSKGRPKTEKKLFFRVGLAFLVIILLVASVYIIVNFKSIKSNFDFWYKTEYSSSNDYNVAQENIVLPKQITEQTTVNLPVIENNSISIPILNLKAPIIWNVTNNPESVKANLEKGVIHISNTSLPGEVGNVFITGHSSNYPWAKGDYNNIFALINKLVVGDLIQIKYHNSDFVYKVSVIKTVKPSDTSVLDPTKKSILTLMTCTPVGTSINRLILIAEQVYPDPALNTQGAASSSDKLPYAR